MPIYYTELANTLKKGLRNGNWKKLSKLEKAFYRAALTYAKIKRKIINPDVISHLTEIMNKLILTPTLKIVKAGLERARHILTQFKKSGAFKWCPQLKKWLQDPTYIFWLGLTEGIYRLTPNPP
ncbi:MAG: hypothetical protein NDF55_03705 [archaeon GB-1867-005]|nr:hypothetical protein [Candidatus Culexmicrobium cathedralense]